MQNEKGEAVIIFFVSDKVRGSRFSASKVCIDKYKSPAITTKIIIKSNSEIRIATLIPLYRQYPASKSITVNKNAFGVKGVNVPCAVIALKCRAAVIFITAQIRVSIKNILATIVFVIVFTMLYRF